ncbi:acyltransferase [Flavobacterium bizetiae]|uniref:acyltransferase n=1 Tax=Flavobacterium bizetiae TaxID=2704140 RepID=UPI0021E774D7|nr:acyltransferase [Flavobacterium bizetiae]UTN04633.1 acyltransferase [Flavobacterium bizetiae]
MVNEAKYSTLGKNNKCKFFVSKNAELILGNNIGMSNVVIVATKSIIIGNNIMIGGGVTIVDSDFHSLNPCHWHTDEDEKNMVNSPVIINDNVFIGMDSIILKGVTIGNNVVIAAGSVVSKSIPENQIWGGNPAKFIRNNEIKS